MVGGAFFWPESKLGLDKVANFWYLYVMPENDPRKIANASVPMTLEMREQIEAIADEREWSLSQTTRKLIQLGLDVQTFTQQEAA
jgi:hypothetical protein